MNILFYFISQINPRSGGTERVADNVAHGLKVRGHQVFYLSRTKVPGSYDIPCFFLPDEVGITNRNIDYINSFCLENHIDVIVNEAGNTDDVYLISKENIKVGKIITELHFSPYQSFKYFYRDLHLPLSWKQPKVSLVNVLKWVKSPLNRYVLWKNMVRRYRYMYEYSDDVVVLSPAYINEFAKIGKLCDTERLHSIYNPKSFLQCHNVPKEKIVLSMGRLVFSQKKIDYLLNIWKQVQKEHSDWKLYICGDGEARPYLEQMVTKEHIEGVVFKGNVSPQPYYERASIFCMTSIFEGTPMVLIEGMQAGCVPIVYDTFSACGDMIRNGENGFIIPPFKEQSYIEKLAYLIENEEARKLMAVEAMKSTEKYDLDLIINEWEILMR